MEDQLDEIANGEARWQAVMEALWGPLAVQVTKAETATSSAPKIQVAHRGTRANRIKRGKSGGQRKPRPKAKPIGRDCPKCGQPLVERKSKYGPFIGCSGYPSCKYTERLQTS
jgi:DNA topoisomerase-1